MGVVRSLLIATVMASASGGALYRFKINDPGSALRQKGAGVIKFYREGPHEVI